MSANTTLVNTTLINTTSGPVIGRSVDGVLQLRGVPFAQTPVGKLADQPPVPAVNWTEPLNALEAGPARRYNRNSSVWACAQQQT